MKNKFFKLALCLMITLVCLTLFFALVDANVWVFTEFFKIAYPKWYQVLGALAVGLVDLSLFVFGIVNSNEIVIPDDDDCE